MHIGSPAHNGSVLVEEVPSIPPQQFKFAMTGSLTPPGPGYRLGLDPRLPIHNDHNRPVDGASLANVSNPDPQTGLWSATVTVVEATLKTFITVPIRIDPPDGGPYRIHSVRVMPLTPEMLKKMKQDQNQGK
jgi:hypothetical protein